MSTNDPWDDPEVQAWSGRVLADLVPKMRASSLALHIVPEHGTATDVKFAVELGYSIMLDMPIILAVRPGTQVPAKLVAVADAVVELGAMGADTGARIRAAIDRVLREREARGG